MHRTLHFSYLLSLLLGSSAYAGEWLQSQALTAMVSGNTAVCRHVSRPSSGRTFFQADGSMYGIRRGEHRSGRWYVQDDTLCTHWGVKPICSRYQSDGHGGHFKYTLAGKQTVHVERWLAGDWVDD